ncbi:MAG: hypothetical protein H6756_02575 [Candidatus Omnitrophica bacterium]|nr:hypothetical protein [Candidatus Omnitrophota bacterium]
MGDEKATFLSDAPLAADKQKDVAFGHASIARNLATIVRDCPKPFTIGFFGKWGTGKTTVLESLYAELKDDAVLIVPVDAWKYEGDSLRRQFLITLDEKLNLGHDYARTLNQSLSENDPTKGKFKFDKEMFCNHIAVLIAVLTAIAGVLKIIANNPSIPILSGWTVSFDLIFNLGLAGYLIQLAVGFFQRVSVTITEPRTDSAEGFERRFRTEVLDNQKVKGKDLLIVIDNLDRCQDDKAVEMLSTIKTFLTDDRNPNKCVFLVACDDDAIKAHIKEVYSKNPAYDADEFLRKFFNTSVRIPPFIETELQSYTEKLLKATGVEALQNDDVSYVITTAFRENPRQIKQFINTLLSTYLLAEDREEIGEIKQKGLITGNSAVLAKMLVLQHKYAEAYRVMLEENKNFEEVRQASITVENNKEENISEGFKDFMGATRAIRIKNIRPFLYLKQSEEERNIPSIQDIEEAMINRDIETLTDRLKEISQDTRQWDHFSRWIPDYLERHKQHVNQLRDCVETLLGAFQNLNISCAPLLANNIARYLTDTGGLHDQLIEMTPSFIWKQVLPGCDLEDRGIIISRYATLFLRINDPNREDDTVSVQFRHAIFEQFLEHSEWMKPHTKNISNAITERYFGDIELLRMLIGRGEQYKDYLQEQVFEKLLGTISDENVMKIDEMNEKLDIVKEYLPIISSSSDTTKNIIQIPQQRIVGLNGKSWSEDKGKILESFGVFLNVFKDVISEGTDTNASQGFHKELSQLSESVIQGLGTTNKPEQRRYFLPLLVNLWELDVAKESTLRNHIAEIFTGIDKVALEAYFSTLPHDEVKRLMKAFTVEFNARFQKDATIREYLHNNSDKETRTDWLINLITSNQYPSALEFLEYQKYKVDDNAKVLQALVTKAEAVSPSQKQPIYVAINSINWKGCIEQRDGYITQLQKFIAQEDQKTQQDAYAGIEGANKNKEFTDTNGSDIARHIIEWLDGLSGENAYQPYAISAVVLLWKYVGKLSNVKSKFIEFVGYKLIKDSNDLKCIQLGFKTLKSLSPVVTDKTDGKLLNDLRERAGSESIEEIKEEMEKGLKGLGVDL